MANNPYVNKVQKADGTTIIDISDTTATAAQIMQGYGAYGADGAWMDGTATAGSSGVVYITDELDEHGGIIRNIDTDDATITDTLDSHGGTVRSITGAEVHLQVKTVTPGATQQVITPDAGYDALGKVIVEAAEPSGGGWEEYIPEETIAAVDFQDTGEYGWQFEGYTVDAPIEIGATYKVIFNGFEYMLTGQLSEEDDPCLGNADFSFSDYPFQLYSWQNNGSTWYWALALPSQPNQTQTIEVYKKVEAAKPMMIVEIENINGTPTADHTFAEIFDALQDGTPVFLHLRSEDAIEDDVAINLLMPVVSVFKYFDVYRVFASCARYQFVEGLSYAFAPALYIMQASDAESAPQFYKILYPSGSNASNSQY